MLSYSKILKKNGKNHVLFLTVLCIFLFTLLAPQTLMSQTITLDELKAFPTAEGFGKHVTGGKDGVVLKVTNLNDRGSGSLRAALEDSRPATIIFEVAGTILLNRSIVSKSNKTVAGETAFRNGGQGITLRMNPSNVFSTPLVDTGGNRSGAFGNHIWRYIRFRRGQGVTGENSGDNFSPWGYAGSFIIDHCSFMFSTDQNVSFPSVDGYTVQNSISAFGLAYATHTYGTKHSKGSLTSNTPYCTWYRNLFSCNDDRNPLIQANRTGITRVELINNFIYNRGIFGVQFQTFYGGAFHADVIGNYFKDGQNSNQNRWGFMWPGETTSEANNTQYYRNPQWDEQRVYVSGNLSPRRTSHNQDEWNLLGSWDDNSNSPQTAKNQHQVNNKLNTGVNTSKIIAAENLQTEMLTDVGVSLYYDTFDSQAISFAINGTGSLVNGNGYSGGGYPEVSSLGPHPNLRNMSSVPADTNNDGIADDWANTHNISNSNEIKAVYDFGNYQVVNNAGYTALDIYLAFLSRDFERMDQGSGNTSVAVTELDIDLDAMTLDLQQTGRLTATISPSNATNQNVNWSSSNTAIAQVDQSGTVTAIGAGSVTITARAVSNNTIYDTASVVVEAAEPIELWLEAECANVGANWNVINDTAASRGRYLLPPSGNYPTEAPSDIESVITFDFTANASSYAIYARTLTPNGTDDSFWIRVNGGAWSMWNQIANNGSFGWNQVHDGNNYNSPVNFNLVDGNNTVEIAHREDGAGLDKVFIANTATVPNGFGPADDSCSADILVNSITVNPEDLDLEIDQTQILNASISPANATNQNVTWSSSDSAITTVDQNGNVTAIAEGNATITATANDGSSVSDTAQVTVSAPPAQEILVENITVNPEQLDLEINQIQAFTANVSPANATDQSITWASSNTNIATVDQNGNVTAIAEGNATITATANDGSGSHDTGLITVNPVPDILVDGITINPQQLDLEINDVQNLSANVSPANATNQSVTWASSDTTVATVDQNGNVTAIAAGSTNIAATANDGSNVSGIALVTVNPAPDILVDTITIAPQQLDLEINQVRAFTATISPENANNRSVTWASSDSDIATVDQNGNVTAIAEGNATITATANDNSNVSGTAQLTVSAAPAANILVDAINLNPQELELELNQVRTLTANVSPVNATDQSITWASSNTDIALVDQNGNVTAIAEGNATITATANDGSNVSDTALVAVNPAPDILVDTITVTPQQLDLEINQVRNLTANVSPANATDQSITWTSSDTNIATVDQSGNITAIAEGTATITATANDGSNASDTALASVITPPVQDILVENISLNPQQLDLEINDAQTLIVTIAPANATDQHITWASDNTSIATVDQNGNVTAIAEGTATITATANDAGNASDSAQVNVTAAPAQNILVESINLNPYELELEIDEVRTLAATIAPENATDQSITWASNNTSIATVDQNGNVTAIAEGSANITATANDASNVSFSALVIVSPAPDILVDGIILNPQVLDLEINQVRTLAVTVSPADATDQNITWASNNTNVATVDQAGNVTAIAEGTATITVTANDGGGTQDTAQVNVSSALARTILVNNISINPQELALEIGQVVVLTANVSPANATDASITWTSSDPTVAIVDQNGNVTAMSGGNTIIAATANDFSSVFDTTQIVVEVINPIQESEFTELWLEAECANIGSNWNLMDDTSASGGKYLLPPSGNNYDGVPTDTSSIIAYNFTLNEGTYSIYARALTPSGNDDSFWVRLNGGEWLLWNQIPSDNNFEWNQIHDGNNVNLPLSFTLLEGNNTLEIAHREDGAGLDKIFITNSTELPSGQGHLDSTCISESVEEIIPVQEEEEEVANAELISPVSLFEFDQPEAPEKTTVFPNPTRNNTVVTFPTKANYTFYSLYSMNGVMIKEGKIENGQNKLPLSLVEMEAGMYLLRLYTDMGEEIFKKIIKK